MNQYDALIITTAGFSVPATIRNTSTEGRSIIEAHGFLCLEIFPEDGRLVRLHSSPERLVSIIDSPDGVTVTILTPTT